MKWVSTAPLQVEHDEMLACVQTGESFTKMTSEFGVVVKPPEGGPADGDARHAFGDHSLEFADGCRIVGRRPPVNTVALRKRPRGAAVMQSPNWPSSTRINVPPGGRRE